MSFLKNLGFGSRGGAQPPYTPDAGMYDMMGGGADAGMGADAVYAPTGYSPNAGMYDMMGAGADDMTVDSKDWKKKMAAWGKKQKKGQGQGGGGLLDPSVTQGMPAVQPFAIVGRGGR